MNIKQFFTNLINSLLDGSFERMRIIGQMNTAFKEYFTSGEFGRLCKVPISQGKSEFAHEMSAMWLRSGFKPMEWNQLNGTRRAAIPVMEWLVGNMKQINSEDLYPQFALLWTYLKAPDAELKEKGSHLMDVLIPIAEKRELWDQYGHMMSLKIFFIADYDKTIELYEPNVDKLVKSPQGAGALVVLSQIYSDKKDNAAKGETYMKLAEQADPQRIEITKWENFIKLTA